MKYMHIKIITLIIVAIGLMISIYDLLFNLNIYWNFGVLIAFIGIIIDNCATSRYLRKYMMEYGEI